MKLVLVLAAALIMAGCHEPNTVSAAPETVSGLQVVTIRQQPVADTIESVGTVHAAEEAQISSQMMGTIVAINVQEGDSVRRAQTLVLLDDAQPRAGVERAQAAVSAAQHEAQAAQSDQSLASSTLKRYQTLYDRKSISPQEFDEFKTRAESASARSESANAALAQAKAALVQAQTSLGYSRVIAPFNGVVTARRMDPGSLVAPGMPILTLEGSGRFRLEAELDERNLALARVGKSVPVHMDALSGVELSGKIVQIVPAANPASRSFTVKIELPSNPGIRSGLFGRAEFTRGSRNAVTIPASAVIARGQMQSAYVVGNDNLASVRYLTLGQTHDGSIEVLSGLSAGERVVLAPGDREINGKRIEVAR